MGASALVAGLAFITTQAVSFVYNTSSAVYTIDYRQQLIVVYRWVNSFDLAYGNVNIQAATLEGGPAEALPVYLLNPVPSGNDFSFSFVTQSNFSYAIEEATSLPSTNWTIMTNISGTGAMISVTNQNGVVGKKFYRVRTY